MKAVEEVVHRKRDEIQSALAAEIQRVELLKKEIAGLEETFDRRSRASFVCSSSLNPKCSANSAVNVCHEYDKRRNGSYSSTTCAGSSMRTPLLTHVIVEPTFQSDSSVVFQ